MAFPVAGTPPVTWQPAAWATGVEIVMMSLGLAAFSLPMTCGRMEASKFATSQSKITSLPST